MPARAITKSWSSLRRIPDSLDNVYNAVANGVGPNMIINYASTAADYVKDGLVVDLSKYVFDR